jgi:hypothetical protein
METAKEKGSAVPNNLLRIDWRWLRFRSTLTYGDDRLCTSI